MGTKGEDRARTLVKSGLWETMNRGGGCAGGEGGKFEKQLGQWK